MDDLEFEALIDKYRNMIYSIIRGLCVYKGASVLSDQDLFQEAIIALYEASCCYDKNLDSSFTTFAYVVIKRKLVRITQKHNKISENESISYDSFTKIDYYDKAVAFQDDEFDLTDAKIKLNKYIKKLNEIDRKIIDLYMQRKTYKQISEFLKLPVKKVDNRLQSIKRQFHKEYLKEENILST